MKRLHIFKSEPDETTLRLVEIISKGEDAAIINLYDGRTTDERLIEELFKHEKVISWW